MCTQLVLSSLTATGYLNGNMIVTVLINDGVNLINTSQKLKDVV